MTFKVSPMTPDGAAWSSSPFLSVRAPRNAFCMRHTPAIATYTTKIHVTEMQLGKFLKNIYVTDTKYIVHECSYKRVL